MELTFELDCETGEVSIHDGDVHLYDAEDMAAAEAYAQGYIDAHDWGEDGDEGEE